MARARTILITGGGTGIGRAVARLFAERGDSVFVTGRRREPLDRLGAEIGATGVVCDHTRPEALTALLAELPERVDVLVNNAGGNTDFDGDREGETPDLVAYAEAFRANLDANLVSAALTTRALDGRLADGGAVVHIGSIAASRGSGAGSYGAAKAGLTTWNLDLARALGSRGITANVVAPGYIADTEFFRDRLPDERREQLVAATVTGRAGSPVDIAETVAFLASPGARHITGQVLHVNGGAYMSS
ncbi:MULTISPECIES: SDR family oxidoreductase [unclassified Streptomyces]|uniref:SDR family NAD(P)-dependent oxidoreductase n=1 Tax=unclassified Streptomyces TaxID=2593676 RepID=UPI001367A1DF|nr:MULTISPECIES: SDR family oxidoreductase [unclassified Streptomyces]NEA01103.1 SDR family oxidoreductase [Streptomyces sp. SID10116]MYY82232.1 SDR family oxidoreductase [Streptomyces sp. SID335]MYZ14432.1 SDR family oxidoreductase [Streptomyces sp. SID337]NDZ86069.1 SDR family oxidoreductase [Streptomyces sp. SID10115]NEB46855.1 SDR family oxidoreductase [Streptomyces sp. SID339]